MGIAGITSMVTSADVAAASALAAGAATTVRIPATGVVAGIVTIGIRMRGKKCSQVEIPIFLRELFPPKKCMERAL